MLTADAGGENAENDGACGRGPSRQPPQEQAARQQSFMTTF